MTPGKYEVESVWIKSVWERIFSLSVELKPFAFTETAVAAKAGTLIITVLLFFQV